MLAFEEECCEKVEVCVKDATHDDILHIYVHLLFSAADLFLASYVIIFILPPGFLNCYCSSSTYYDILQMAVV